jgi:8-oxo-dGTP diphosphatase
MLKDRPLTSVDIVIFSLMTDALQVLLVRRAISSNEPFPGAWALPGGFIDVHRDHDLEACALRKLFEETGVSRPYLEELGSWGSAVRDPRGWSATHVFFSLLAQDDIGRAALQEEAFWAKIDGTAVQNKLAFDHAPILEAAVLRLRNRVAYTSLPAFFLPREFTLSELQRVNETILGRSLDRKAFRTRILATRLLDKVPRQRKGANRPAQLYRLRHRKQPLIFSRALASR